MNQPEIKTIITKFSTTSLLTSICQVHIESAFYTEHLWPKNSLWRNQVLSYFLFSLQLKGTLPSCIIQAYINIGMTLNFSAIGKNMVLILINISTNTTPVKQLMQLIARYSNLFQALQGLRETIIFTQYSVKMLNQSTEYLIHVNNVHFINCILHKNCTQ